MKTLLQINSSMKGESSQSSKLANDLSDRILTHSPDIKHIKRDLSKDEIPHLDEETFQSFQNDLTDIESGVNDKLTISNDLIEELESADILIITAPMYNFMLPSTLKSWIDFVVRAGRTFQFTEAGPESLLSNKDTYIIMTQGGMSLGTSDDFMTPYLKQILGLIGLHNIQFIYVQGLAMGDGIANKNIEAAYDKMVTLLG